MAKVDKEQALNSFLNWVDKTFPGSKRKILATAKIDQGTRNQLSGLGVFPTDFFNIGTPVAPQVPYAYPATPPIAPVTDNADNWFEKTLTSVLDATAKVIPAYTNYNLQKDAYKLQMERAKQGKEPIDLSQYGTMPVRIQHGIDPSTFNREAIIAEMEMDQETKNALMIGGGIIAAIFLLPKLMTR